MKIIRRKLVKAGYDKKKRQELHYLLWQWIKIINKNDLYTNRKAVLDQLREKGRTYFVEYYQKLEPHFVLCYTRMYANLGAQSTQRSESTHSDTKEHVTKHTPIHQSISRISNASNRRQKEYEKRINTQKAKLSIYMNRKLFKDIDAKITHQAIDMVTQEWVVMMEWSKAIEAGKEEEPEGDDECLLKCSLSKQFGLPCKCFLYACMVDERPIPMLLIHSRWLLKDPELVTRRWRMSLYNSDSDDHQDQPTDSQVNDDMYTNKGQHLLETVALKSFEYHKNLPAHQAEDYAKQKARMEAR